MKHELDTAAQQVVEGHLAQSIIEGLKEAIAWTRGEIELPITEYADDGSVARRWVGGHVPVATQPARPLVIIESPYAGDVDANAVYARACLLDSLSHDEAPIASHLLYTQVLDDDNPIGRYDGIEAGLAWYRVAEKCVVYTDRGISEGMQHGIERARQHGVAVEYRTIEA